MSKQWESSRFKPIYIHCSRRRSSRYQSQYIGKTVNPNIYLRSKYTLSWTLIIHYLYHYYCPTIQGPNKSDRALNISPVVIFTVLELPNNPHLLTPTSTYRDKPLLVPLQSKPFMSNKWSSFYNTFQGIFLGKYH